MKIFWLGLPVLFKSLNILCRLKSLSLCKLLFCLRGILHLSCYPNTFCRDSFLCVVYYWLQVFSCRQYYFVVATDNFLVTTFYHVKIEKLLKNDHQHYTVSYKNPLQPVNNPQSVLTLLIISSVCGCSCD